MPMATTGLDGGEENNLKIFNLKMVAVGTRRRSVRPQAEMDAQPKERQTAGGNGPPVRTAALLWC